MGFPDARFSLSPTAGRVRSMVWERAIELRISAAAATSDRCGTSPRTLRFNSSVHLGTCGVRGRQAAHGGEKRCLAPEMAYDEIIRSAPLAPPH